MHTPRILPPLKGNPNASSLLRLRCPLPCGLRHRCGGAADLISIPPSGGYMNFNRFFLAQAGKQAAVLDER